MALQAGYWFPCDGAVAFDLSAAPEKPKTARSARLLSALARFEPHVVDEFEGALVDRLMAQASLIAALCERAECCFQFRVVTADESRRSDGSDVTEILWRRSSALHHRHGRLLDADLVMTESLFFGHGAEP